MALTRPQRPRLPDETEESHVRMSFGEHLEELRRRLIYALLGSALAVGVCLWYTRTLIVPFLVAPYQYALRIGGFDDRFLNTGPAEVVISYLSIGLKAGLILAAPWIIYQVWLFVAAGLYQHERKVVYRYIGPSILLFLAGVAFFYFVVLPLTLWFFVDFSRRTAPPTREPTALERKFLGEAPTHGYTEEELRNLPSGEAAKPAPIPVLTSDPPKPPPGQMYIWYNIREGRLKGRIGEDTVSFLIAQQDSLFTPLPKLDEYLHFVLFMALAFGLCFEMPMIMLVLARLRIVTSRTFSAWRKYAYFAIAILAAILAPSPDVLTMIALLVPLILLYEFGVLLAWLLVKPEPQEPEEAL